MRKISILFVLLAMNCFSQSKKTNVAKDFTDKTVDFVIENSDDKFIELPDLYNQIRTEIGTDDKEKLILAEKLKQRGFTQTDWRGGNNNGFPSPRIIQVSLKKADCECQIEKVYYITINEGEYTMTERIKCKKISK